MTKLKTSHAKQIHLFKEKIEMSPSLSTKLNDMMLS